MTTSKPRGFRGTSKPGSVITKQQRIKDVGKLEQTKASLEGDELKTFIENEHIRQVYVCGRTLLKDSRLKGSDRYILDINDDKTYPRSEYKRRTAEVKTVLHFGQRKLLIMEIEFLTKYAEDNDIIIYAGAASGSHHTLLSILFPTLYFILYDPGDFDRIIKTTDKREVHKKFFTIHTSQVLASKYRNKRILFISDVRRFEMDLSSKENNELIEEDMMNQWKWLRILDPFASLLKFKLPYTPGQTIYLKGTIYIQPWVGATSTETRLVVTDNRSSTIYDNAIYESVLFHHNIYKRTTYFQNVEGVKFPEKQCHCYDCASELYILGEYTKKYSGDPVQIKEAISQVFS